MAAEGKWGEEKAQRSRGMEGYVKTIKRPLTSTAELLEPLKIF